MRKSLLKNLLLIVLLISNTFFIYKWWNAPERRHKQPKDIIIERLHFDNQQVVAYEKLIKEHRKQIRSLENQLNNKKTLLFADISKPISSKVSQEIETIEIRILNVHYSHFQDIRSICHENQLKDFKQLNKEIIQLFAPPKPPKPP